MSQKIIFLIFINSFMFIFSLKADTIYLKNGQVIKGKIIAEDRENITIQEKFEGFGIGESNYQREDVIKIIAETPLDLVDIKVKEVQSFTLEQMKNAIDRILGDKTLVTKFTFSKKLYQVNYYYPTFNDKIKDRLNLEKNVFKILSVFMKNEIADFISIEIKAAAVGENRKGIISRALVTQRQFELYKKNSANMTVSKIEEFSFNEEFSK